MARQAGAGSDPVARPDKPGPQTLLREIRLGKCLFIGGFCLSVLAIVQSLVRALTNDCFGYLPHVCALKLFTPSDALTVFTGLVALFYTRKQILDAQLPYVTYRGKPKSMDDAKADATSSPLARSGDSFGITLKNVGNGSAIVAAVRYHIRVDGRLHSDLDYDKVLSQMKARGLIPETDFVLESIGVGSALGKDDTLTMFEILKSRWQAIDLLDCDFDFRDVGGRLYRKQVFLIPRDRDARFPAASAVDAAQDGRQAADGQKASAV